MMGMAGVGFLRAIVVVVVVKMKRQESAMGFTQDVDDGSGICVRKSDRRRKDAERINGYQGGGAPASKSIGQPGQHNAQANPLSDASDIIFRSRGERKMATHRPRRPIRLSGFAVNPASANRRLPLTSLAANGVYVTHEHRRPR
jgi:hypothetical protein